ncbi:MAG: hypothetical protein WBM13_03150 [Bacteroidia bacterium]
MVKKILLVFSLFFNLSFVFSQKTQPYFQKLLHNIPVDSSWTAMKHFIETSENFKDSLIGPEKTWVIVKPFYNKYAPLLAQIELINDPTGTYIHIEYIYAYLKKEAIKEYKEIKKHLDGITKGIEVFYARKETSEKELKKHEAKAEEGLESISYSLDNSIKFIYGCTWQFENHSHSSEVEITLYEQEKAPTDKNIIVTSVIDMRFDITNKK